MHNTFVVGHKQHPSVPATVARGGTAIEKNGGACRKFWKEPFRATKIMFCGCGLNFSLEVPIRLFFISALYLKRLRGLL